MGEKRKHEGFVVFNCVYRFFILFHPSALRTRALSSSSSDVDSTQFCANYIIIECH